MNLFFFYQGDLEQLLTTHDYGFQKYQNFANYINFNKTKKPGDHSEVLQPIFTTTFDCYQYDFVRQFVQTLHAVEEMGVKSPELHGKIAKKIIKYVLQQGNKSIDVKE